MKRVLLQAYIKKADLALDLYQEAFQAQANNIYRDDQGQLVHGEIQLKGCVLALSQANNDQAGSTMQFCIHFETEAQIKKAYQVLKDQADIHHDLGPTFYSPLMVDFTDQFMVKWCFFI